MSITELSKMQITELKQAYLAQLAENVLRLAEVRIAETSGLSRNFLAAFWQTAVMCHSKRQCYYEMTVNKNGQLSIG